LVQKLPQRLQLFLFFLICMTTPNSQAELGGWLLSSCWLVNTGSIQCPPNLGVNSPKIGTARKSGLDGCIQVYIGCSHPIQTRASTTEWITDQFKLSGQTLGPLSLNWSAIHLVALAQVWIGWPIQYKLRCGHLSQIFCLCGSCSTKTL
jgi:hypothetical protein